MMDEGARQQARARGDRADTLLRDPMLQEAFKTLRQEYTQAWQNTHLKDTDGRERLWQAVHLVGKIEDHLKRIAADGRLATRDLAEIKYLKR